MQNGGDAFIFNDNSKARFFSHRLISTALHKPFRVYRSRLLRPGGMFCTQRCFWQAWRAFRRALAKGQLEDILEMPVSQEVLKTDAPATRRRLAVRR
jgi:hypothetical protein